MEASLFSLKQDTISNFMEYRDYLITEINKLESYIKAQNSNLSADLTKLLTLDDTGLAQFKQKRLDATNTLLWNKLLDLAGFDAFYDHSIRKAFFTHDLPEFNLENGQRFLDQYGCLNENFKRLIAKDFTKLINDGHWEKDILENGRVVGIHFNYPALVKTSENTYKINEKLKRLMMRIEFMSLTEANKKFNMFKSSSNLDNEREMPENHYNIGSAEHRIHLLAYPNYFILMAGTHMNELVTLEEYTVA